MNKKWLFILIAFAGIALTLHLLIPGITLRMVTNFEPYTFEQVLESQELRSEYGIFDNSSPTDYGFSFQIVDFSSLDDTSLNGWYIQAKQASDKCLVLIHGRTSNRLKTMKYLALVDSLDLDSAYNVFIPDLRNSGQSAEAITHMGYNFGEDVTAALLMLHRDFGQDTMMLYAFSMGAMAVCNMLGRAELSNLLKQNEIMVEKVIFDSPLVNVRETLKYQFSQYPVLPWYFDKTFTLFSKDVSGFGDSMRMSLLLPTEMPTLILQTKTDQTTINDILDIELSEMPVHNRMHVVYFEGPGHVKIFQDAEHRDQYIEAVSDFLGVD